MHFLYNTLVAAAICYLFGQVSSQCTFGATFNRTTWVDNTKGTLTFTSNTMTGWKFTSIKTTGTSTVNPTWQCVNHTDDNYLVLRTRSQFSFQPLSTTTAKFVYAYLCLKLTKVSNYSFIYYQQQAQEPNLGFERLKVSTFTTLYQEDVCDLTVFVPTPEYHVLVRSGNESSAAIQCPDSLLLIADYVYHNNDGTSKCTSVGDSQLDVCSVKSELYINYNKCSQPIAFSAGGSLYCVATVRYNGYDYTTVYNRDTTLSADSRRFACFSISGSDMSIAPNNCTSYQNPFSFPLLADQTTKTGHRLVIQQQYVDCGLATAGGGLTPGEIAAIVVSIFVFLYIWTVTTIIIIIIVIIALRTVLVFLLEYTDIADHVPRTKPPVQEMPDVIRNNTAIDKERLNVLESVVATSPAHIELREKNEEHSVKVHKEKSKKEMKNGHNDVHKHKTTPEQVELEEKGKTQRLPPFKF